MQRILLIMSPAYTFQSLECQGKLEDLAELLNSRLEIAVVTADDRPRNDTTEASEEIHKLL